ncbi:MAG TPA: ABC transporter permease [Acidobacteria bacterium]|nr:ABC transporter permease [Acidobacteriota bacterium]
MRELLQCIRAFLVRDFQVESSYRLAFVLQGLGLFVSSTLWYFIAGVFGGTRNPDLAEAMGNVGYFPFVLVGLMVNRFQEVSLNAYAAQIRQEQTTGTLEAMLVTPARLGHLMLAASSWSYLMAGMQSAMYLVFGVFVFGVELDPGNLLGALLAVVLTAAAVSGIGILSAAFVLYFKRGNPVNFVISATSALFGNIFFPSQMLPDSLSWLARFVPLSYASNAVRGALLRGASLAQLAPDLLALAAFAAVLMPAGLFGARLAIRRAKREGTLVQY